MVITNDGYRIMVHSASSWLVMGNDARPTTSDPRDVADRWDLGEILNLLHPVALGPGTVNLYCKHTVFFT